MKIAIRLLKALGITAGVFVLAMSFCLVFQYAIQGDFGKWILAIIVFGITLWWAFTLTGPKERIPVTPEDRRKRGQ